MKIPKDLKIDILASGQMRIERSDIESNEVLVDFLSEIYTEDELEALKEFLSGAEYIDIILGDKSFCG